MPVSPNDSRAPYLQIADELRAAIKRGDYLPGGRIPSTNALVEQHAVARNTVRSALRVLSDEGLLVARQGSGVFVRSTVPEPVAESHDAQLEAVLQQLAGLAADVRGLGERISELEARADTDPADR